MMTDYLIDTHAHLDFTELYDRLEEVLDNAKNNNVKRIISISTNLNKIDKIINLSYKNEEVFFTVGIHPNEVLKDENNSNYDLINNISKKTKCERHVVFLNHFESFLRIYWRKMRGRPSAAQQKHGGGGLRPPPCFVLIFLQ